MTQIDPRSPALWHEGMELTIALDGGATGGTRSLCVLVAQPGARLPRRRHTREDVTVLVCGGEAEVVTVDGRRVLARGDRADVPRGSTFGLRATSATPAVLALELRPAGFETTLEAVSTQTPDERLDPDDVAALLAAAGVTLVAGPG